jgi:hypothetical protein
MQLFNWPRGPVYILIIAILMILIPGWMEGPVIYKIDGQHNLTLVNAMALIPLMISAAWIQKGIWKRRIYLFNKVTVYPGAAVLIIFSMGLGLGMLLANAFREFHYWWAIGGSFFIIMLVDVVLISGHSQK